MFLSLYIYSIYSSKTIATKKDVNDVILDDRRIDRWRDDISLFVQFSFVQNKKRLFCILSTHKKAF